jgi:8-oxo-dGTP pyrophosphatase MutT (NUDIX family)
MLDFTHNGQRFHYRVAGVAIQDEHVLLHTMDGADYWILPGGRVEFGETSMQALKREMREELGQTVEIGRLLWIVESFLTAAAQPIHSIGLYYAISLPTPSSIGDGYEIVDTGVRLTFAWHPLARLAGLTVFPPFLQQHLAALPDHPTHILDNRR